MSPSFLLSRASTASMLQDLWAPCWCRSACNAEQLVRLLELLTFGKEGAIAGEGGWGENGKLDCNLVLLRALPLAFSWI